LRAQLEMKLLVFAHTPPPHHGQSYMVKLMLDRLGGDTRKQGKSEIRNPKSEIECYHVNCRYSDNLEDIGSFRVEKAWLVLRYCIEAIWCRFRYDVHAFYYVPAPGKRAALYRDWIVMLLCRPFFRDFIHHWHAVGLGDWLEHEGTWFERRVTHWLLGEPLLGLALAIPSMRDALWFRTRHVELVANGITDPCPNFDGQVLPVRRARLAARRALLAGETVAPELRAQAGADPEIVGVLYLAHCTESKGLFDTLEAIVLANASTSRGPLRFHLTVAGGFVTDAEERRFRRRIAEPDLASVVRYAGFVSGEVKAQLLYASDLFCFPTFYEAEGQPVNLIEAMACGIAAVSTRWRTIPDLLPPDYPGIVAPHGPAAVAERLAQLAVLDLAAALRAHFVDNFTEARHVGVLRAALLRAAA
jgi:glycosyltransferase involved in cell wall biosynthesis